MAVVQEPPETIPSADPAGKNGVPSKLNARPGKERWAPVQGARAVAAGTPTLLFGAVSIHGTVTQSNG